MPKQSDSQKTSPNDDVGHVDIMVRMPSTMHKRFEAVQKREVRSANAQILYYLRQVPELQPQEGS